MHSYEEEEELPPELLEELEQEVELEEMFHRGHGIFVNKDGHQRLPSLKGIECDCNNADLVLCRGQRKMGYAKPRYILCKSCNGKSAVSMTTQFAIANFKNYPHYYGEYDI